MTLEIGISIASSLFATLSIAISWYCFSNYRTQRSYNETYSKQLEYLENSLSENAELLENNGDRSERQARRIAWLEMRIRKPKTGNKDIIDEKGIRHSRLNITERRHRILKLASRGQDAETIASNLKMMPGEVELILNLSRPLPSFA